MHITEESNRKIAELLIEAGADTNFKTQNVMQVLITTSNLWGVMTNAHFMNAGSTPLMRATLSADIGVVEALLKFGANINEKNNMGETALKLANSQNTKKHKSVAHILKKAGAIE